MESESTANKIKLADGRILGYAEYGDPGGQPLLYFHGGVSSRLDIGFAHKYLKERGVKVISPDRPGIGISSPNRHRSMLDWADDVEQLLDHLQIESLPLLGWSLGGSYAYACAYKLPQRFTKIATVGGASPLLQPLSANDLGMWSDRMLLFCPPSLHWLLSLVIATMGKFPLPLVKYLILTELSSCDQEIVKSLSDHEASHFILESTRQGGLGIIDDYNAYARPWGFSVADIPGKVTLWQGDDDYLCPMTMSQYLQENIKDATLKVIPEHGHFLMHRKMSEILDELM